MEKNDLSYRINECAMYVHNSIGPGHMEYIYCRALAIMFKKKGIKFEREVWLPIFFEKYKIGYRRTDFLVEDYYIIEVKAVKALDTNNKQQTISTLKAINKKEGSLLNFGSPKLEFKHIFNKAIRPESDFIDASAELVGEINDDIFESRHYLPVWLAAKMQHDRLKAKK